MNRAAESRRRAPLCAALSVVVLSAGCYGAAPPRPEPVPLPPLRAGARLTVETERDTRMENVRKKAKHCPSGHTSESGDCTVTHYTEREPVTRVTTTARYGDEPVNLAQFRVMTDPAYDQKLRELDTLSASCRRANVPRWIGAGLTIGGLVAIGAASKDRQWLNTVGTAAVAGGAGSYALGYWAFGGTDCNRAELLYRQVDLRRAAAITEVSGAAAAEEMAEVAERFNLRQNSPDAAATSSGK